MDIFENTYCKKVMIIDDNKIDRYVVEMVIKKTNFAKEVLKMESGREALSYLSLNTENQDNLPGIILLDVDMPEMNGFDFLDKYDNLPESLKKECSIMMLTSSVHPTDIERASVNRYIVKFINKPLNAVKLADLQQII